VPLRKKSFFNFFLTAKVLTARGGTGIKSLLALPLKKNFFFGFPKGAFKCNKIWIDLSLVFYKYKFYKLKNLHTFSLYTCLCCAKIIAFEIDLQTAPILGFIVFLALQSNFGHFCEQ